MPASSSKLFTVISAGAMVRSAGSPAPVLALHHEVVELDADEAKRLTDLAAVREATEEDLAADEARRAVTIDAVPQSSAVPFNTSLEQHAAEEIERAGSAKK